MRKLPREQAAYLYGGDCSGFGKGWIVKRLREEDLTNVVDDLPKPAEETILRAVALWGG
jgi:hypothetical protein